jgi:hypothetical protein
MQIQNKPTWEIQQSQEGIKQEAEYEAEKTLAQINSIGGCGCDSDVRAFLSDGTSVQLDAYADSEIPQHRNCFGYLAHDGRSVFCTKCNKTLFSLNNYCHDCECETLNPHWALEDDGYKAHRIPLCEGCFQERRKEEEAN